MPTTPTPQRILILDDDEIMRDLLDVLLTPEGYRVTLAQSGEEALRLLRAGQSFEIVLTDVQLPGLGGEALIRILRESIPQTASLIGMSGSEPPPDTRALFDAFLLKPFEVQLLRDAISGAATRKGANGHLIASRQSLHANPADPSMPPLDTKIFGSLTGMISATKLRELFAMALIDIGKRHKRIEEAAAEGDLLTVRREAHAIKGSCGMIGASELHHLAAAIEDGTTVNTPAIEEIPRACDRLQRMLESKLHTV